MSAESMIRCVYRIEGDESTAQRIAREIAVEQTVEVPESLISPAIERDFVGDIESVIPHHDEAGNAFLATISYHEHLAGGHLAQLFNLIYGNSSINPRIRLVDCQLPTSFLHRFRGPNVGIDGLRKQLGVAGRPLLCSALKPRGLSNDHFANLARDYALGGGDLIKDDHNLVSNDPDEFRDRVRRCQQALNDANKSTGRCCLYLPYISAAVEELPRQIDFAINEGVHGILISPALFGLEVIRRIADTYPLFIMAHPTMTGAYYASATHGIDPGLYLGTFLRLAGVDASVFTNFGGRFNLSRDHCRNIAERCREPRARLKPAWPTPAGGMRLDRLDDLAETYGRDTIFLIGGALLERKPDLTTATRELLDRIRERFDEQHSSPGLAQSSRCEGTIAGAASTDKPAPQHIAHLPCQLDQFRWAGRRVDEYKSEQLATTFRNVSRVELIGKFGEETAFDLRYFEIAPNGCTSREIHRHTHVIIGARGSGLLEIKSRDAINTPDADHATKSFEITPFDIAYVPPNVVHQLRNTSSAEPFGFFCIVDHDRDRPIIV